MKNEIINISDDKSWLQKVAKHARRKMLLKSTSNRLKKNNVEDMDWRELHYVAKHYLKESEY